MLRLLDLFSGIENMGAKKKKASSKKKKGKGGEASPEAAADAPLDPEIERKFKIIRSVGEECVNKLVSKHRFSLVGVTIIPHSKGCYTYCAGSTTFRCWNRTCPCSV